MTTPQAFFASGMTSVTPEALARSSIAVMRSREASVGRLADVSTQRAMRGGGTAPSARGGGARRRASRRMKTGARTPRYFIGTAGIPLSVPQTTRCRVFPRRTPRRVVPLAMLMQVDPRREFPRRFVPVAAGMGGWAQIEPLFQELLRRPLASMADLEQWLFDCSEL